MMYQVGKPDMLEGKRFLELTGTPNLNAERARRPLAVWLPEPLTVATTIEKSFTIVGRLSLLSVTGISSTSVVLMAHSPNRGCRVVHRGFDFRVPPDPIALEPNSALILVLVRRGGQSSLRRLPCDRFR